MNSEEASRGLFLPDRGLFQGGAVAQLSFPLTLDPSCPSWPRSHSELVDDFIMSFHFVAVVVIVVILMLMLIFFGCHCFKSESHLIVVVVDVVVVVIVVVVLIAIV